MSDHARVHINISNSLLKGEFENCFLSYRCKKSALSWRFAIILLINKFLTSLTLSQSRVSGLLLYLAQNRRLVEVGGTTGSHLVQTSAQVGTPRKGCPNRVQESFEALQGGDSSTSLDNLCQGFVTCTAQKYCLVFKGNILCSSLCPLPLLLSLGTTEKSLSLSSLHPPIRCW